MFEPDLNQNVKAGQLSRLESRTHKPEVSGLVPCPVTLNSIFIILRHTLGTLSGKLNGFPWSLNGSGKWNRTTDLRLMSPAL